MHYWDAGWRGILPLPFKNKTWPPTGYTGHSGIDTSFADCLTFLDDGQQNICLRMPADIVGIDVDHYNEKTGGNTLAELVEKFGALPPTIMSTSRDDGISGIRLYRIPEGASLPSKLDGIEFVQRHHRYAVVWPSVHPEGRTYQWINERTGKPTGIPNTKDLPELPARWIQGLVIHEKEHAIKADIDATAAADVVAAMPPGEPCQHMLKAAGRALAGGDRHDSYNEAVLAATGYGRRGCPGFEPTIRRLRAAFISEISDPSVGRASRSEALAEFGRSLKGALAIVANEPAGTTCPDDVAEWIESLPPQTTTTIESVDPAEPVEPTPFDRAVRVKYGEMLITDAAKDMLATFKAGQAPPMDGRSLTEFLAEVEDPEEYRIQDLWPAQGRVLLAAQAKSGKTTLVAANLLRSLVDGEDFLGRYHVKKVQRRVIYLNMEVGTRTMRKWLHDAGIVNTSAITVANLRGKAGALALLTVNGRKQLGAWIATHDGEIVILDPLAPLLAALGLDENSNSDVAKFFTWWNEALAYGGVIDDVVVHHAGHGGERSRGASRLLDEPDAIWTLTKDTENKAPRNDDPFADTTPMRYLSAYGRDVELPAEALKFDPMTRRLELTGMSRSSMGMNSNERRVIQLMSDLMPRSKNEIAHALGGNRNTIYSAIEFLIKDTTLVKFGPKGSGATYIYVPELDVDPRDLVGEK